MIPVNVLGLKLKMQKEKEQLMHEHLEEMFEELSRIVVENLSLKEKVSTSTLLSPQEENEEEDVYTDEEEQEKYGNPPVYMFVVEDTLFWSYELALAVASQTDSNLSVYAAHMITESEYQEKHP